MHKRRELGLVLLLAALLGPRSLTPPVHAADSPLPVATNYDAPASTTGPPLLARAQCLANTFPCPTSLGDAFRGVCCQDGQTCALDASHNPACCPLGAVCTGTAPATPPAGGPTAAVSFVSNAYFSFPYAATTFANSASCASAVKACSGNYDACVTALQGSGAYGVTIHVPGGQGTTVAGPQRNLGASATSVCSSLSSEACSGLAATRCESFGQASAAAAKRPLGGPVPVLAAALVAGASTLFLRAWP